MKFKYNIDFLTDKSKKNTLKRAINILEKTFYSHIDEVGFFVDPFDENILLNIARTNNINVFFYPLNCERKLFISSIHEEIENKYTTIMKSKSTCIEHRDVLGALISLGINREDIGDIHILDNSFEICVSNKISNYIQYNLTKIRNEHVKLIIKKDFQFSEYENKFISKKIFVSSLRLDNVISAMLNLSREKSKSLINKKNIKVNHIYILTPSFLIQKDSTISIRGYGRYEFIGIKNISKKGNFLIEFKKFI